MTSAVLDRSMNSVGDTRFGLGDARIDPPRNRIERGGRSVRIEPKVMQVLVTLAERPGAVFPRDHLIRQVWGDVAVGDEVLTRAISELRRALQDDPKRPAYIETVYKTGYRLIPQPHSLIPQPHSGGGEMERSATNDEPGAIRLDTPPSSASTPRRRGLRLLLATMAVLAAFVWLGQRVASTPQASTRAHAATLLLRPFGQADLVPITTFPGHEFFSPFSPDGEAIALVWEGPHGGTQYDLWIKRLDEDEPLRLTNTAAFEDTPTWTPEGDHLVYVRNQADGGIFIRPLLGGAERRLLDTRFGTIAGISFAPDGRSLALSADPPGDPPARLLRLELASQEVTPLTAPPAGSLGDVAPVWSPDGRSIAFDRMGSVREDQDIFVATVPVTGYDGPLAVRRLTADHQWISGKAWMVDSKSLVYACQRNGYSQLWQLELDGTVHNLSGSLSRMMSPAVSADGDRLSFTRKVVEQNIWRAPLVATDSVATDSVAMDSVATDSVAMDRAAPFIVSTRIDVSPTFAPDGARLAFVSYRSGHPELWSSDRDGRNVRRLTDFGGPLLRMPRWSPDGQTLVFEVVRTGYSELHTVAADGGPTVRLSHRGASEAYGSWSPDGRFLYFASNRSGRWQVWRRSTHDGAVEQVTTGGGRASFMTARGLYFTRPGQPGIWHLDRDNVGAETPAEGISRARQIQQSLPERLAGQWLVHEDGLYFIDTDRQPRIRRLDLDDGSVSEVMALARTGWDDQIFSIDPRGEHIVFGSPDRIESDIWMVELERR